MPLLLVYPMAVERPALQYEVHCLWARTMSHFRRPVKVIFGIPPDGKYLGFPPFGSALVNDLFYLTLVGGEVQHHKRAVVSSVYLMA
jgi:hypothetical protein